MTDRSSREVGENHTIQLLIHGDNDREALEEFLDERYDVIVDDTLQPVDCYVVGEQMVPTYRDALREHKKEAHPTFTPVLLIQQEGSRGTVPLPSEQNGDGPPLIDEVVSAPVDRTTLFRRVGNLLARREQSVELSTRYEDVQIRFQRLFDSTNDAIFVVAPSGDEINECNPAACDLVGYSRDELLSISPTETIHADERERFQSFLQQVQEAGQGSTDDLTCQTQEGEKRQLEVSAATLRDVKQSRIILSARDVTERKDYERELELKSQSMNKAPVGITITDPDREDNPMIYVNEEFEALTGHSESESLGRNCRFLQGEATREEPVADMRKAVKKGEPVSVELRNYRKDGSQFWNRVSIAPVRDDAGTVENYVGFQEDVSERKEREMDLELFKKAVENAGHAVFITDTEGTIEYVNPQFEARSGYTREEAVGRTPRILKSGKQDEEFYDRMWQTILSGEQWNASLINQRKNGELYHVDQTISPIASDDGEITHFVTIESDVTNRRLRKQQIDVLNRVMRHNLKNGMNVIQGRAELLRESLGDDEHRANVRAIEERADALATLGDKAGTVRSLFENEFSTETATNVTELVSDVVTTVSEEYSTASFDVDDSDPLYARADSRLKVAVKELLDNAVVHNDQPKPEVTVTTRPSREKQSEQWIEIEIVDNGPGIPDQELETIKQGEETPLQHGTGLGLWIVYWTVSLYGGEVTFVDNSPRGTGVVLNLPRMSADSSVRGTLVEHH
ncbi:PAS domain S-box protein [Salinadaptatus halalkaliphilus]|uniref:PAS domain S-box protein n=1 Tax=Salinadaptatus halalkaliphilus TaxID=2419781 RepID=A0A4S3TKF9_9EURY|nr:PAS domain S-box protein [Salinadaptatus halalkaliphilus]THE64619.1 PAS domain S-box protein [Salinadaptatus halalkaliphilus]